MEAQAIKIIRISLSSHPFAIRKDTRLLVRQSCH
jgi:hypothetical protein